MTKDDEKLSLFSEQRTENNSRGPCLNGELYLRIAVDGSCTPCCVSEVPVGNIFKESFTEVWNSDARHVFCDKLRTIHKDNFHLTEIEWYFCKDCPYAHSNME